MLERLSTGWGLTGMGKRSITDEEIALIKAMLVRKMKNKDIQFFFNRPDRSVNSGRITGIAAGAYSNSAEIPAASDATLDAFIQNFQTSGISASISVPASSAPVTKPTSPIAIENVLALFAQGADGIWRLTVGESDQHECKTNFGFKFPGAWLKAIAALANNRGGYVFFGVRDKDSEQKDGVDMSYAVTGLTTDEFAKADLEDISKRLKSAFDPTPRIQVTSIGIGGKKIGVIYVDQHGSRPVIALKNEGDQIKEGDIFFRYPGQSSRIKYGDLRALLDERDAQARLDIIPLVEKLLSIGPKRAMIADLDAGVLSDGKRPILIDEGLIERIKFIREGSFSEAEGAPALRLVGDVHAVDATTVLKKGFATKEDLIRDFVKQEAPYDPCEYIRCAVEGTQSDWLPIHFFARKASLDALGLASFIEATAASRARKNVFSKRARGEKTAYKKCGGTPLLVQHKIERGTIPAIKSAKDAANIGLAICGLLAKPFDAPAPLLSILEKGMEMAADDAQGSKMSILRRAICRVDELYFFGDPTHSPEGASAPACAV
ncbi:MAG: helix-turn-helix domain-containing protein [Bacteroidales bacterium]